jgi:CBS domain-containing protein
MRCADIMKSKVETTTEEETIQRAAERMATLNIGFLPVSDASGNVLGTITDRDITIRAVASNLGPDTTVGEVMTRELVACGPEDDVAVAEQLMGGYQKSRMVVTDAQGHLLGVISLSDIAQSEPGRRVAKTLREVAAREFRD